MIAGITTAAAPPFPLATTWRGARGVRAAWRDFDAAFGARFDAGVTARQVHGREVRWYENEPAGWLILDGVDGHATSRKGLLLTVSVADCVPVYLSTRDGRAVALVHAGWRGTAARVLACAIESLARQANVPRMDIVIHCGISICGTCYEVGSEVFQALGETPPPGGKGPIDLRANLVAQARAAGVREVSVSPFCTAHDTGRFHSHRASAGHAGRMIAFIGLPLGNS